MVAKFTVVVCRGYRLRWAVVRTSMGNVLYFPAALRCMHRSYSLFVERGGSCICVCSVHDVYVFVS